MERTVIFLSSFSIFNIGFVGKAIDFLLYCYTKKLISVSLFFAYSVDFDFDFAVFELS